MAKIQRLDELLIAQIAAGEVIENPPAVLKELLENSLDARANDIDILIRNNGFAKIEVRDNGSGIAKEDLPLTVESFATSKLLSLDDLQKILTLGFRGEALASMRSVGRLCIESKACDADIAYRICAEQKFVSDVSPVALPQGTRIVLEDLFARLPARKKFQKNDTLLQKELLDVFFTYALGFFTNSFAYDDSKKRFQISSCKNMLDRIVQVYPQHKKENFFAVFAEKEGATLQGYVSDFSIQKNNRSHVYLFVNQRPVYYSPLMKILTQVYGEMLPKGKFPLAILHYQPSPLDIDVNVHPGKKEIRFHRESTVKDFFYTTLLQSLSAEGALRSSQTRSKLPAAKLLPSAYQGFTQPSLHQSLGQVQEYNKNFSAQEISDSDSHQHQKENKNENLPYAPFLSLDLPSDLRTETDTICEAKTSLQSIQEQPQQTQTPKDFLMQEKNFLQKVSAADESSAFELPENCRYYGRLFNTFAVFACEDSLLLMDQHTAFERIAYETILQKIKAQEDIQQKLLHPLALQLSQPENAFVEAHSKNFSMLGFTLQNLGPAGYALLSIPYYVEEGLEQEAFFKALQIFKDNEGEEFSAYVLFEELAASLACRGAVKKGDTVAAADLQEAFEKLMQCRQPFRCPHGRPTVVKIARQEVFLWFNRTGSRAK